MEPTVAIIGFGAAGAAAVAELRVAGYTGRIIVFTAGTAMPYSPVAGSYFAGGELQSEQCYILSDALLQQMNLEIHANCAVTALDPRTRTFTTSEGTFTCDYLLVATGAAPLAYAGPGCDVLQPFYLRGLGDAWVLREQLVAGAKKVLVSGTSLIAMKAAEACMAQGAAVTMLGRGERVLKSVAFPQMSLRVEQALAAQGVSLRLGQSIAGIGEVAGRAATVTFSDGTQERFDAVVVAHGTVSNLPFIDQNLLVNGALEVDASQQTRFEHVFAAGDAALVACADGGKRSAGLFKECCDQGTVAARAIAALAGGPSAQMPAYPPMLRCNIVRMNTIALVSFGNMACPDARVEEYEQDGCVVARALTASGKVVAVNVLGTTAQTSAIALTIGEQELRKFKR